MEGMCMATERQRERGGGLVVVSLGSGFRHSSINPSQISQKERRHEKAASLLSFGSIPPKGHLHES